MLVDQRHTAIGDDIPQTLSFRQAVAPAVAAKLRPLAQQLVEPMHAPASPSADPAWPGAVVPLLVLSARPSVVHSAHNQSPIEM